MRERLDQPLLDGIKERLPELEALLIKINDHWNYEDGLYRFYHQSYKVYHLQNLTREMVDEFLFVISDVKLNESFCKILSEGTGKLFDSSHNKDWLKHTRPIVEAFLHAKYFLEMMVKYGRELVVAPQSLPSGWAAILTLYNTR